MTMTTTERVALIDLDSMLHLIAYKQWKAGNRSDPDKVKAHVKRFYNNIKKNTKCTHSIALFQTNNHANFRKDILKTYKAHRVKQEWIKHWKPTIIEAFDTLGGIALGSLESDDAQSILAKEIGYNNVVIVSGDKDMNQVPGTHYNPFKPKLDAEQRWQTFTPDIAKRNLYLQVLTGDPTDMPNELCGIQGIGLAKASKLIGNRTDYLKVVQEAYSSKYGDKAFERANLTYKLVRLLTGDEQEDKYATAAAKIETNLIKLIYKDCMVPIKDSIKDLFGTSDTFKLFNN